MPSGPRSRRATAPDNRSTGKAAGTSYDFLVAGGDLTPASLTTAFRLADKWGVFPHQAMIATGILTADAYVAALARHLRWPALSDQALAGWRRIAGKGIPGVAIYVDPHLGAALGVADALAGMPETISDRTEAAAELLAEHPLASIALATPARLSRHHTDAGRAALVEDAAESLARQTPLLSAKRGLSLVQIISLIFLCGVLIGAAAIAPVDALFLVTGLVSLPILLLVIVRALILALNITRPSLIARRKRTRIPDHELPIYTVLVPLFREALVLPSLAAALQRLDYPAAKLDIKLLLEEADPETIEVARGLNLPPQFEIIIVPDRQPRTKPKALNYALELARGEFLVIFDAEDLPHEGQLRLAVDRFRQGPPNLACVQAMLAIDNDRASWLTAEFAIEYLVLFRAILPALEWLKLPIPLGGTSNHFPTERLRAAGGWDAYNVTEDADLGVRLYRQGSRAAMIPSLTYEEAPHRAWPWIKQRSRWLKGFMQTYVVHMRSPGRLLTELGPWKFLGIQALFLGMLLSVLVHPLAYAALAAGLWRYGLSPATVGVGQQVVLLVSGTLVVLGYFGSLLLSLSAILRARAFRLIPYLLLTPLYWLLISFAGYRALFQFIADPHAWEKTEHGLSGAMRPRRPARQH